MRPTVDARVALATLGLALAACGGGGARQVEIVLVAPDVELGCAAPAGAQRVDLFALGDFVEVGESGDATAALTTSRFPATTRALRLAVIGPGGGTLAIGRTGSFDATTLADGGQVPLLLGPPRGFCQVGPLAQARRRPTVARAGAGVLVVGGLDSQGGPVGVGELYDPARGVFELLAEAPFPRLAGASAVTLDDGRVFLVWQDGFQIFDPRTRHFGDPTLAAGADLHSYAQAVKLADGRVLVAGGCAEDDVEPPCAAAASVAVFDPDKSRFAPARELAEARAGGAAWLDGDGRVLLVGGFDAAGAVATTAEGWDESASTAVVSGVVGASAALGVGGVIAGFAPGGASEANGTRLVGPLGAAGGTGSGVVARAGATMTVLDDDAVLVVGGVGAGAAANVPEAELYQAHAARFDAVATTPEMLGGRRREHGAVRLDDGSVLIVGGRSGGGGGAAEVRGDAWIYRHDVTGPWSSVATQIFLADGTPLVVPFDAVAARVEQGASRQLRIVSQALRAGPLGGWAVLAGPTYADVVLAGTVGVADGAGGRAGVAALLGMTSAGDYLAVSLVPGQVVRASVVTGAVPGAVVCEGSAEVASDALAVAVGAPLHALQVDRRGTSLRVDLDGATLLSCDGAPATRGAVGFGVVGGVGSVLRIASVAATR